MRPPVSAAAPGSAYCAGVGDAPPRAPRHRMRLAPRHATGRTRERPAPPSRDPRVTHAHASNPRTASLPLCCLPRRTTKLSGGGGRVAVSTRGNQCRPRCPLQRLVRRLVQRRVPTPRMPRHSCELAGAARRRADLAAGSPSRARGSAWHRANPRSRRCHCYSLTADASRTTKLSGGRGPCRRSHPRSTTPPPVSAAAPGSASPSLARRRAPARHRARSAERFTPRAHEHPIAPCPGMVLLT